MMNKIVWAACALCMALAWTSDGYGGEADGAPGPPLAPKPYTIGIAPSHITKPTAPLFGERADDWDEVRGAIDFYKIYSLQATPPKWASPLPVDSFADFVKKHKIAVDAEFGSFRPEGGEGEGKAAAKRARSMHAWLGHRGLKLRALHLDGPIRRLTGWDREANDGLTLATGAKVVRVTTAEDGKHVHLECEGGPEEIVVDEILIGLGRQPNVEGLHLEAAGVEYDPRKGVQVNDRL